MVPCIVNAVVIIDEVGGGHVQVVVIVDVGGDCVIQVVATAIIGAGGFEGWWSVLVSGSWDLAEFWVRLTQPLW